MDEVTMDMEPLEQLLRLLERAHKGSLSEEEYTQLKAAIDALGYLRQEGIADEDAIEPHLPEIWPQIGGEKTVAAPKEEEEHPRDEVQKQPEAGGERVPEKR